MGLLVLDKFESFVGVNFWTMLFAWINLFILYLVLKKLLFKPLKNMIDSRQKEIDDMYEGAEGARSEADALRREYETRLEGAREESEEILKSAVKRARAKEEEMLALANEKASLTLARAEKQIELEKARAVNELKDEMSEMALDIARAVVERDVSAEEHKELIDEFIEKIGKEE